MPILGGDAPGVREVQRAHSIRFGHPCLLGCPSAPLRLLLPLHQIKALNSANAPDSPHFTHMHLPHTYRTLSYARLHRSSTLTHLHDALAHSHKHSRKRRTLTIILAHKHTRTQVQCHANRQSRNLPTKNHSSTPAHHHASPPSHRPTHSSLLHTMARRRSSAILQATSELDQSQLCDQGGGASSSR